jgi:hypothetical protein
MPIIPMDFLFPDIVEVTEKLGWEGYDNVFQALRNSHHLRELKLIQERYGQTWAEEMAEPLVKIKQTVDLTKELRPEHLPKAEKGSLKPANGG